MIKRFIKTTWRSLAKNKAFSLLNIVGLAIGIACAGLILLWVEFYTTFNSSIKDLPQLYEVKNNQVYGDDHFTFSATPFKLKDAMRQKYPEVEAATRFTDQTMTLTLGETHLTQKGGFADSSFLSMFGFKLLRGNAKTALANPDQIAISRKVAEAYFGTVEVIGNAIEVDKQPYKVAAVYEDLPENVTFQVDLLVPFNAFYQQHKSMDSWGNNIIQTWVKLKPGAQLANFNQKFSKLAKDHGSDNVFFMYPMERFALYNVFLEGKESSGGMIKLVKMFSLVAFIILLIACINFMNLSTARSEKRAREIGLRKVLGSSRSQLIGRLLGEAMLMAFMALILAVLIMAAALPLFNGLIGIHLRLDLFSPRHLLILLSLGLISGLAAGSYPAFYLSSFNPVRALKKQISKTAGGVSLIRKSLVVIQFSISAIIIIAIMVIYHQIQYTRSRDLGFDKNNVLFIPKTEDLGKSFPALKNALLKTGMVNSVSLGSGSPLGLHSNGSGATWAGNNDKDDVLITYVKTGADYLKTFGIQMKSGRSFFDQGRADSNHIIINSSLAKLMGDAGRVGEKIYWGDDPNSAMTIVGITKDFVYNNISAARPAPLIFIKDESATNAIYLKLEATSDLSAVLDNLKTVFGKYDAGQPFDYHFIDKDFESKFKQQRFTGSLAIIFGSLAIVISCLGLFGLSAFMAEQRTKEISIRKVLGASVTSVIRLLSVEFLLLVGCSCLIAFPVAYYLMNNWLNGYDYRIDIHWPVFAVTALVTLLIAFVTVWSQAFKAARSNPIKAIKTD